MTISQIQQLLWDEVERGGDGAEPRPATEGSAARSGDAGEIPGPPSCNTGVKVTWTERAIGIDWLRVSFPEGGGHIARVRALMEERFGPAEDCKGPHGYLAGLIWPNKSMLWYARAGVETVEDPQASCCVEINGKTLSTMEGMERFAFCREVSEGGRGRRVDIALDFHSDGKVGVIDAMVKSALAGEMCRFSKWTPELHYDGANITGYGMRAGGKGSGRQMCVYDKGLETGEKPRGKHERLEMRWNRDHAEEALQQLLNSDSYYRTAFNLVIGGVEFREVSEGKGRHLARRKIADFWQTITEGGVPASSTPKRAPTRLGNFSAWVRETVMPTLRLVGEKLDCSASSALGYLMEGFAEAKIATKQQKAALVGDLEKLMLARPPRLYFE